MALSIMDGIVIHIQFRVSPNYRNLQLVLASSSSQLSHNPIKMIYVKIYLKLQLMNILHNLIAIDINHIFFDFIYIEEGWPELDPLTRINGWLTMVSESANCLGSMK